MRNRMFIVSGMTTAAICSLAVAEITSSPAYVVSTSPLVEQIVPLLTVGDDVGGYRLVGIPDGMGAYATSDTSLRLLINHELNQTQGVPRAHGGTGAFVSQWDINIENDNGDLAFDVIAGADRILAVQDWNDATGQYVNVASGQFARLCSAYLGGPQSGFTDWIFLTGEETNNSGTLDGVDGGQSFAVIGQTAYALPRLGRYAKENQVALPGTGNKTVIIGLDDSSPSQIFAYVGKKRPGSRDALRQNGLDNGKLFVMRVDGIADEGQLIKGQTYRFDMVEINWSLPEGELRQAAAALGATNFVRIEDGTYDRSDNDVFYFVTTGGNESNPNGKLHKLDFRNASNPKAGGTLTVLLDGSEGIVSPDNLDLDDAGQMLIQEDPTYTLTGRDSSLWVYNVGSGSLDRVLEIDTELALSLDPTHSLGNWETSGAIDASSLLGAGWWLINVQAHYSLEDPELVQGGQLLAVKLATP